MPNSNQPVTDQSGCYLRPPEQTDNGTEYLPSAFCRLRFSSMLLTGVLLDLVREHYGNPSFIVDPTLKKFIWRQGDDTSILIESCGTVTETRVQQCPAILVKRHAIRTKRLGLNDELKGGAIRGLTQYTEIMEGAHTLFCMSKLSGAAENLANETALYLQELAPTIRGSLGLEYDFRLTEIGELALQEGENETYVVPITFDHASCHSWGIGHNVTPIRKISFKMLLDPTGKLF
jgi:hypothetical protein